MPNTLLVLFLLMCMLHFRENNAGFFKDLLKKADCLIPKQPDQIGVLSCASEVEENATDCFKNLGCFPMVEPWFGILRPFPKPFEPEKINVKLYLYTRLAPERYNVTLWPDISLEESDFNPSRNATVFICHGFASSSDAEWLSEMKDAYLKLVDANVFLVDWKNGASLINYLQVASNTRVVGAELTRFGNYLVEEGVEKSSIHLIGHSLGSHISSYMAKGMKTLTKVGRITALDPAQPGFEGTSSDVRLSSDDAEFVDAIHTDARPFVPFLGFGMMGPIGHVDFYLNGGSGQPGCIQGIFDKNITSIKDIALIPVEVLWNFVACSHGRAYEIFTSSLLLQDNCTLWGRKMSTVEKLLKIGTLGKLALADPIVDAIDKCSPETCTIIGLETPLFQARGYFAASTTNTFPYCAFEIDKDRKIKNLLTGGLYGVSTKIISSISSVVRSSKNLLRLRTASNISNAEDF